MDNLSKNSDSLPVIQGKKVKQSQKEILLQPLTHITQTKHADRWRKLAKAFNFWLDISEDQFKPIDECFEMLNYADLLIDDIRDDASSRGGVSSSHIAYGVPYTLNTHFYAQGVAVTKLPNPNQTHILYKELLEKTCEAQRKELSWRSTAICPSEDEYLQMIIKKTYGLLTTEIKTMQLFSTDQNNFTKLSGIFGLYFQILADCGGSESENFCKDVTLGRFNFPIIHAIRSELDVDEKIIEIMRLHKKSTELKDYLASLLERFGSFEYTKSLLSALREEALREMKKHKKNPLMEKFIADYMPKTDNSSSNMEEIIRNVNIHIEQIDNIHYQMTPCEVQKILRPLSHLGDAPDKNIKVTFMHILNHWLNIPEDKVSIITDIVNYIHESANLVDDIQDGSTLRRGIPTAYSIYGIANTANASRYIYGMLIGKLLELDHPEALSVFLEVTIEGAKAQGMEIYWRENLICPTEEEYVQNCISKLGGLFLTGSKLMQLFTTTNKNVTKFVKSFCQYFQIRDDFKNLTDKKYFESKGFCEDLTEGKFGLPVIHAINTNPELGQQIIDILGQRTYDDNLKSRCMALIKECGSLKYSEDKVNVLKDVLFYELSKLGNNPLLLEFMRNKAFVTNI